jgi:UDP-N-acetylglucosamine--N-acetylmuramyl-(pentapeptide) pyrophosphoryl-undecaprenol N-acetylglucosamine transferase
LKTILRTTRVAALSTKASLPFLAGLNFEVTGYPVRREVSRWVRKDARMHFGISEDEKILLVFGGSKGALSINIALAGAFEPLLKDMHIIHISGKDNWAETETHAAQLPANLKSKYHAYPFLHDDMGAAFAAADLAVCRSGASTLGELPIFGLPAILVPYPFAWRYQQQNAEYLQSHGGARILEDKEMPLELESVVREIMDDPEQLATMKQAMKALAAPNAAERIAELILRSAGSELKEEKHG